MTAKQLKEKYPVFWNEVEIGVLEDIKATKSNDPAVIAFNAAFIATCVYGGFFERDKIASRWEKKVAGKTRKQHRKAAICSPCMGRGRVWNRHGISYPCSKCGGTGKRAAVA